MNKEELKKQIKSDESDLVKVEKFILNLGYPPKDIRSFAHANVEKSI